MSDNPDIPDTPPEVLARQSASRPLTAATAELIGSRAYLSEGGKMVGDGYTEMVRQNSAASKARARAEQYAGGSPVKGLTPDQHAEIKNRAYEDAPAMDAELGDRTPAFVNWLWSNKPNDAKVRYAYRDIWPTVLPEAWPIAATGNVVTENAPQTPQQEIEQLRAELAALKAAPPAAVRTPRKRAARPKVRAVPPATTTTV